jgi:hypothetical protein
MKKPTRTMLTPQDLEALEGAADGLLSLMERYYPVSLYDEGLNTNHKVMLQSALLIAMALMASKGDES